MTSGSQSFLLTTKVRNNWYIFRILNFKYFKSYLGLLLYTAKLKKGHKLLKIRLLLFHGDFFRRFLSFRGRLGVWKFLSFRFLEGETLPHFLFTKDLFPTDFAVNTPFCRNYFLLSQHVINKKQIFFPCGEISPYLCSVKSKQVFFHRL